MTDVNSLDNMNQGGENPDIKNTILKYGGILGLIGIISVMVTGILSDPSNPNQMAGIVTGCGSFIITIAIYVFAIKSIRDSEFNAGKISLGTGFKIAFLAGLLGTLIQVLFTYLYHTVINPSMLASARDLMDAAAEGADENTAGIMSSMSSLYSAKGQLLMGLVMGPIFSAIIGIIVAAIMKRD